jgi:hypothetical protein
MIDENESCSCHESLKDAIMTNTECIDKAMMEKFSLFIDKYKKK